MEGDAEAEMEAAHFSMRGSGGGSGSSQKDDRIHVTANKGVWRLPDLGGRMKRKDREKAAELCYGW